MDKDQEKIASGKRGDVAACGPSPGPGCWAVWMPIETAPKTNRSILVYCPDCNCQFMVCWNDHQNEWTVFGAYPERLKHEPAQWRELPDDPPNPAVRGDRKAGVPCTGVVRRVSDGKILPVIGESKGADLDEILVVQAFPFWSPTGTVMKPMKMWQPRSRYEPYIRTANPSHHAEPRLGGDSVDGVVGG